MRVETNIKTVIKRLERLEKELPQALADSIHPTKGGDSSWSAILRRAAEKTLLALAASERVVTRRDELTAIARDMADTFTGELMAAGSRFSMGRAERGVRSSEAPIAEVVATSQMSMTPTGKPSRSARFTPEERVTNQQNLDAVRQAIMDWVIYEKVRTEQDTDKDGNPLSNEEIASRLEWIMGIGTPPGLWGAGMQAAGERLAARIQEFVANESGQMDRVRSAESHTGEVTAGRGLDEATVKQWLMAVLITWRAVISDRLPTRIRRQIALLHQRISTELPL